MAESGLRISVVIPHLNQPEMLRRCLRSLRTGRRKANEIIVVDNGSTELPTAICAEEGNVRLLREETPGPGPARNAGVEASSGEILAFIDADCLADPGWLEAAEAAMQNAEAHILGGDVRIACADPERLTMLEAYESIYAYRMDLYIRREGFTGTGNLIVRRKALSAVGPFAGLTVAEDRDWGQRATAMGYRITYVPTMKVYHPARRDFSEMRKKWDRHTAHDYVSSAGRPGGSLRFILKTFAMSVSPIGEIPRIVLSDRVSGLRNRALAFLCLARTRLYRTRRMISLLAGENPTNLAGAWNRE